MVELTPCNLDTTRGKLGWDTLKRATACIDKYECVVLMDGKWTEISCKTCGGKNAMFDDSLETSRFLVGIRGLFKHMQTTHKSDPQSRHDIDRIFKYFRRRYVTDGDVDRMKAGLKPLVEIKIRVQKSTSSAEALSESDDDDDPRSGGVDLFQASTSGGGHWVLLMRKMRYSAKHDCVRQSCASNMLRKGAKRRKH